MNKKKTAITIFVSILLMIIVSCSDLNPFSAGGVVPGGNWIYFAEGSTIKRMRLDGTEPENVFTVSNMTIRKIQLDPFREKIYISNIYNGVDYTIYEYNLDGTGGKQVTNNGSFVIEDMTIDHTNGYLYFIPGPNGIKSYNLETFQIGDVYTLALGTTPFYVTPDYNGGVYFVETGSLQKVSSTTTRDVISAVGSIYGLCYDRLGNNLYSTAMTGMIYKIDPANGTSSGIATFEDLKDSIVISSAESKIYFYDDNASTPPYSIFSINKDGSGKKLIISNLLSSSSLPISSLHLHHPFRARRVMATP